MQAYSANDLNTVETVDPRYQRTIGQRVELSFLDSYLVNLAYCSGQCATVRHSSCSAGSLLS